MGKKKKEEDTEPTINKRKLTGGKVLAFLIGAIVVVYMLFTLNVFYNFIQLTITDSDAANEDVSIIHSVEEDL